MEKENNKIGLYVSGGNLPDKFPSYLSAWIHVKTYEEFCNFIRNYFTESNSLPELIHIDHDITNSHLELQAKRKDGEPIDYDKWGIDTGLHAASWLCAFARDMDIYIDRISVSGKNRTGMYNMLKVINDYKKIKGNYTESPCMVLDWE